MEGDGRPGTLRWNARYVNSTHLVGCVAGYRTIGDGGIAGRMGRDPGSAVKTCTPSRSCRVEISDPLPTHTAPGGAAKAAYPRGRCASTHLTRHAGAAPRELPIEHKSHTLTEGSEGGSEGGDVAAAGSSTAGEKSGPMVNAPGGSDAAEPPVNNVSVSGWLFKTPSRLGPTISSRPRESHLLASASTAASEVDGIATERTSRRGSFSQALHRFSSQVHCHTWQCMHVQRTWHCRTRIRCAPCGAASSLVAASLVARAYCWRVSCNASGQALLRAAWP